MVRHTPSPYPTAPALLPTTAPASSAGIPDSSTASATIGSAPSPATAPVAPTLKNPGTAGTYPKIPFDAQGRETSGTTLSAGDIPAIPESGVTSLVTDLSQRQLTNE